jgi:NTE family protein
LEQLQVSGVAKRTPFECIALLLQGGGALGSYQGGVYQALAEADLHPNWVAGVSIGAVNSALIAGNPPERRVEKLREFWETVSSPPLGPFGVPYNPSVEIKHDFTHRMVNQARALGIMLFGAPGFFEPRFPSPVLWPSQRSDAISYYDVAPLKATLERLVDFDRINKAAEMRLSVGTVNVRTGNSVYFDTKTHVIGPAHVIASGSLPPAFRRPRSKASIIGMAALSPTLSRPRLDTLAFQIDLWSARGDVPRDMTEIEIRLKDIQYSSRTRAATDRYERQQKLRLAFANLFNELPESMRTNKDVQTLKEQADNKVCNIVHLIYRCMTYERSAKDFEFSRRTMEEHWRVGYNDAVRALSHREVLELPDRIDGVRTFDFTKVRSD